MIGTSITYKFAEGIFCKYCVDEMPHCYVCGIPVSQAYTKLDDGRVMCRECGRTAVLTMAALRMINNRVAVFLRLKFDMEVTRDYQLELAQSRKELGVDDRAVEGNEQGLFRCTDGKSTILILSGAPEAMCHETMAHEYAHAWHAEHGMNHADKEVREGFAQWAASKTLEHFGFDKELDRLKARTDPDYGTGYKIFAEVEKTKGTEGVFEFLRKKSGKSGRDER
jgi:hypothetical protein